LELIRQHEAEAQRIPPGRVDAEHATAAAPGKDSRRLFPAGVPADFSAVSLPSNHAPDQQPEQEDYLWGV
jgi:hypothetical protein